MAIPIRSACNNHIRRKAKRKTKLRTSKRCRRDFLTSPRECSCDTVDMQLWKDCNPLDLHSSAQASPVVLSLYRAG